MSSSTIREPRWPAFVAMLGAAGVYLALPEPLSLGPSWLLLAIVGFLLVPILVSDLYGHYQVAWILTFIINGVITVAMIASLAFLVRGIPQHLETPKELLRSASALWITNILVFALWYWKLDAGGPRERELRGVHTDGAFLFPQMTLDQQAKREMGEQCWSPGFVDYLFLAFNTSTAFSPTDCPVLSAWAKLLMMIQSLISLATVALLAARAVNIL